MDVSILSKAIFSADFVSLPKEILEGFAISFNIDNGRELNNVDIANAIYEKLHCSETGEMISHGEMKVLKNKFYNDIRNIVFAGKTSIIWYQLNENQCKIVLDDALLNHYDFKGFDIEKKIDVQKLTNTPEVIKIIKLGDGIFLLRVIAKTGFVRIPMGTGIDVRPLTTLFSIIVNQKEGFIEIRSDSQIANRAIKRLAQIIQVASREPIEDYSVMPFGVNIEKFASELGGKVIESVSKPEMLKNKVLSVEQLNAVVCILHTIDEYLDTQDEKVLLEKLEKNKHDLYDSGDFDNIQFSALVLIGMEKLGLTALKETDCDLQFNPLYAILKPYLQQQGGCIKFPVVENGMQVSHTIKVGITTNSIAFRTYATEEAIGKVREVVLKNGVKK